MQNKQNSTQKHYQTECNIHTTRYIKVQEAIKYVKIYNLTKFDQINIRHLKHLQLYTFALNTNIIPHIWKLANIIHNSKTK